MAEFVNPYAFVPFADPPERKAPNGHAALEVGNYSGALSVTLRARTPLLLGGFGPDNKRVPQRVDGRLMIPGSGLLGAVRSVHEAMAGGCLRVIDRHYTPVHRDPANTEVTKNLRLAMVLDVDRDGRPLRVTLCADVVWISKELLGWARLPATGDRLTFTGTSRQVGNRDVLTEGEVTRRRRMSGGEVDGTWVLLVTDTQARNPEMPVYFAAGRPGDGTATVTDGAWSSYLRRVDGTRDMQQLRQQHKDIDRRRGRVYRLSDEPKPAYLPVSWPPPGDDTPEEERTPIAGRLAVRPYLRVGQPIWVEVTGSGLAQKVTEIRPAQLWRSQGSTPVLDRIGAARPCDDADRLCWSCRIFGSADVDGQRDEVSVQQAYRGHVRVEDAEVIGEPALRTWALAPLATPKPSAGQFYLTKPGTAGVASAKDEAPAANWGSTADAAPVRRIAGRKFYWRTTDPAGGEQPRGRRRNHQSEEMTRTVELVPEGAEFATRVAFDNLRLADLGSLVAALDPRRLWAATGQDGDYVISVGGGKPFGFGAVTVTVELALVASARSRYLGESFDGPADEELLEEAVRAFLAEVPGGVRERWTALRNLLTLGYIADDLVWYPPGAGKRGEPGYDRGFDFWQQTSGVQLSQERRSLAGLPDPAGTPDQQVLTTPEARTSKAKRARQ